MGTESLIEWTDATWNPVVGCSKVSLGCDNCYAERMAYRLACMGQEKYKGVTTYYDSHNGWNGLVYCDESALEIPLHWKKPRMIFVCSMSDLFHPSVPFRFIEQVMAVIEECQQHTFQILTKRPEIMTEYFNVLGKRYELSNCPNLWLGVTAENQAMANKRIPILLQIPAAVRFVSIEPMLGAVGLDRALCICKHWKSSDGRNEAPWHPEDITKIKYKKQSLRSVNYQTIDWVIVGGESGPGARPMHPDHARSIRDQCVAAGVPFFFKQWGGVNKKKAGRLLDGRTWDELPGLVGKAGE